MTSDSETVSPAGVRAAAERLKGVALVTPLLESAHLNDRVGGRVLLKAEILQHCGSFKFRGAYNRLSRLTAAEKERGVLAWSSGNHAQGVARAARLLGVKATIVMPDDAPAVKVARVKEDGAEIVFFDRYKEDREAIGLALAEERGLALAPSYDHPDIIHGQGTIGLELAAQADAMGAGIDRFVICCGGGGMTAGCATILEELSPKTQVWIAEPEGFDESWASIQKGERVSADTSRRTLCDALAAPTPGALTFPIMKRLVRGGVSVTDDEVKAAMAYAFTYLKLVLEPGGAAALAGVLTGKAGAAGRTVAVTLSGGNVDASLYAAAIAGKP